MSIPTQAEVDAADLLSFNQAETAEAHRKACRTLTAAARATRSGQASYTFVWGAFSAEPCTPERRPFTVAHIILAARCALILAT